MIKNKYILSFATSINSQFANTALIKPKTDAINILKKYGFKEPIKIEQLYYNKTNNIGGIKGKFYQIQTLFSLFLFFIKLGKDDLVFVQYPFYSKRISNLIKFFLHKKNFKSILYVHDIQFPQENILRMFSKEEELTLIKSFDIVILHNESMVKLVQAANDKCRYLSLNIFDYLTTPDSAVTENDGQKVDPYSIVYAGNLAGSMFIKELKQIKKFNFFIYGINFKDEFEGDNIYYKGVVPMDKMLNETQKYAFGLIWNGWSCSKLEGNEGEYAKYNNPYKFSSYMAAGIPVVVPTESAIADYVSKHNIGICVNSLHELNDVEIDVEDYLIMKKNVMNIQKRVINGENLGTLIEKILEHES